MNKLTGDGSYLDRASSIAKGAMGEMIDANGILTEYGYPNADETSAQFKGVLVRHLAELQKLRPDGQIVSFLQKQADAVWANARTSDGTLAADWQGPQSYVGVGSSCSGMDALVAAAAVS